MNVKNIEDMFKEEPLHEDLVPYIQEGPLGQSLHHPLVIQIFYTPGLNHMSNQQYLHKLEYIKKATEKKEWSSIIWMYERPYRLEKFLEIADKLTDQEYWKILGDIWSDSENLWQYKIILNSLLDANRSGREAMMNDDERIFLESLPDELIIYRGHQEINRLGHSWTLSYWQAKWFASRFKQTKNSVVQAIVSKKDIIAALLGRNEFEIIVDPNKLKCIEPIRKIKRPDWLERLKLEFESQCSNKKSHHGPWHWEKVEKNALDLSKKTSGSDKLVAQLFALIHDTKRENEFDDPEHGHRAASYAKELFDKAKLLITSKQLEKLMFACSYHNDGSTSNDPTIGVCWDADRLDLPRVGIIPEKQFLSTQAAKDLLWTI